MTSSYHVTCHFVILWFIYLFFIFIYFLIFEINFLFKKIPRVKSISCHVSKSVFYIQFGPNIPNFFSLWC